MSLSDDEAWMSRAIALARDGVGRTGDNPSVGCVIVANGGAVGEGATGEGGRPHAEELAVAQAGARARGATAYVTLEPCAQRSNGTASCADRLAAAGVARVVVACEDPSVMAGGRGAARLKGAGIAYDIGVLRGEAAALLAPYRPRLGPKRRETRG